MNLSEFLKNPLIQLPADRTSAGFIDFLQVRLSEYAGMLDRLTAPAQVGDVLADRRSAIDAFCEHGSSVAREIFEGHPHRAYDTFVNLIEPFWPVIQNSVRPRTDRSGIRFLYRTRIEWGGPLTRGELFHIPFQMRERVATQRYSIPGLPCLYLGGSLYTCWAEMGRPSFHEMYASAFWFAPGQTTSIIDMSCRSDRLAIYVDDTGAVRGNDADDLEFNTAMLADYVSLWPLAFLCSIRVQNRAAPFKPEYIVPQILLQWITQEKEEIDGICYPSAHVNGPADENRIPVCNFVFPSRRIAADGYCSHLSGKFHMTLPQNCQLLKAVNAGDDINVHAWPTYKFEFIAGRPEDYRRTDFGAIEARLNKLAYHDQGTSEGAVTSP